MHIIPHDTVTLNYTALAERFRVIASNEQSLALKAKWEHFADCYAQLADKSQSFEDP